MTINKKRAKIFSLTVWMLLFTFGLVGLVIGQEEDEQPPSYIPLVHIIKIDGIINPVSAEFIINSIGTAKESGAEALIIELDTPGGLVDSTRDIVKELLKSQLPVIVFVSPSGAHAGSAGTMITMAADIAIMAPGTNIGAASPVSAFGEMDETMKNKVTNDVAAWVEGIAEQRGRNKDWAIKAVREAVSVTATEAKKLNVVDMLADDVPDVLNSVDGMILEINSKKKVLHTKGANLHRNEMGMKQKFMDRLADPNLAFIFLIIGVMGLYAEFSHPGLILPGVAGGVCLVLFLITIQVLPINVFGLLLMALGIVLFVLEFKFTSYGALTVGGLAALTAGSLFLFDVPEKIVDYPNFKLQVSWSYIIPSVLTIAAFVLGITYVIVNAARRKPETGNEGIMGKLGTASGPINNENGRVVVVGEIWKAVSDEPIEDGAAIIVEGVSKSGLLLKVKKAPSQFE